MMASDEVWIGKNKRQGWGVAEGDAHGKLETPGTAGRLLCRDP